jgi:hypothetical protein
MNPTVSFMRAPSDDFDNFLADDFESRHGGRRVVQLRGTAYNVVAMREYSYQVDREGRIFHDGTEIVDAATLRFFLLALQRAPDGRWLAVCQGEQNWFEAYDTPFVVQRLGLGVAEGRLRSVELHFAGDYREPLDPATLEQDGARLFCRVRKGAFTARFGRLTMQQIAPWLADDGTGPVITLDGRHHPLGAVQPRAPTSQPRAQTSQPKAQTK